MLIPLTCETCEYGCPYHIGDKPDYEMWCTLKNAETDKDGLCKEWEEIHEQH